MSFEIELLNLSLINKENVDYDMIIFYMNYPEKIDIDTSREIMLFLTTLIKGGAKKIIVDMKKVTLIDSAGISTLISATKQIRKNNGDLVLSHVNDSIQNILDIIKIEKFIKISSQENDLILDCYAGSGTTGEACENLNRKYILIEKEIEYCNIIKQRIENLPKYQFAGELF